MITKLGIVKFLHHVGELDSEEIKTDIDYQQDIVGINTDKEAKKGELAWISKNEVLKEPERLKNFLGSLLITPREIDTSCISSQQIIQCEHPKLAFIKVVTTFFSSLSATEWPKLGDGAIYPGSFIGSKVILSKGVVIGSGVTLEDGVIIGPNTVIANCTVQQNSIVGSNCSIGLPGFGFDKDENGKWWRFPHIGRVIIEENVEIGSNTCIDRGSIGNTVICQGAKIDNLVHIAHNVIVGAHTLVIANSMLGGSASIGDNVWVAPSVSIMNQVSVGDRALLGMGAVVLKNVGESTVMAGNPARLLRKTNIKE
jgi:UDP-3-O-[3-hydroxymyristoyl] glucosamine N-acyltransferase